MSNFTYEINIFALAKFSRNCITLQFIMRWGCMMLLIDVGSEDKQSRKSMLIPSEPMRQARILPEMQPRGRNFR